MGLLEKDKRKFNVIIGSKKCGVCFGTSPSLAAKKVKGKSVAFYLKETTKDSKKKLYGPYSSKKRIVQRGGEENTLIDRICENVLKILRSCDKPVLFDSEMKRINNKYNILEQTYLFLGINHRQDKCKTLKEIITQRDIYTIPTGTDVSLEYCLCSLNEKKHSLVEIPFCNIHKLLINKRLNKNTDFYTSNWIKFIDFLRITIRLIEIEIREQRRKNNVRLEQFKTELNEETNKQLNEMTREIEKAKAFHAAQSGPANNRRFARAGPAEELTSNNHVNSELKKQPSYLLRNNELEELGINPNGNSIAANQPINLSQIPRNMLNPVARQRNLNPIQPSHNNQNKKLKLEERLAAALRNNNNKKPASTNNLSARLAAALRND